MRNFKELEVWKEGRILAKDVYLLTKSLPEDEGSAKDSQKDFSLFLQISLGSCFELESHLILCLDLEITNKTETENCLENIQRLQKRVASFIKYVNTKV